MSTTMYRWCLIPLIWKKTPGLLWWSWGWQAQSVFSMFNRDFLGTRWLKPPCSQIFCSHYTLEDERLEPTNHPFRKENDLPNLHEDMFQPLIFQGVNPWNFQWSNKNSGDFCNSSAADGHLDLHSQTRSKIHDPIWISHGRPWFRDLESLKKTSKNKACKGKQWFAVRGKKFAWIKSYTAPGVIANLCRWCSPDRPHGPTAIFVTLVSSFRGYRLAALALP